jgi:hypothetical protein
MNSKTCFIVLSILSVLPSAFCFEGRITANLSQGGQAQTFFYTVGESQIRIERGETDRPYSKNIVDFQTGAMTLIFPHNRTFVHLKAGAASVPSQSVGGFPSMVRVGEVPQGMPTPPPRVGPSNLPESFNPPQMPSVPQMPAGVGPQAAPGVSAMPAMPMMPPMPMERAELKATDQTTNILGYICTRYELKRRGEVMEIWATDKLLPYRAWQRGQPPRFGPRMFEEQWGELLSAQKIFPLLAILKFENGPERLRFEVTSIKSEKIEDKDGSLFAPPQDYQEIEALAF